MIVIKICKNGPYLVPVGIPLTSEIIVTDAEGYSREYRHGKKYTPEEDYALCRCGQSGNKPFCDGTHAKICFDGTEHDTGKPCLDGAEETDGPSLKLTDKRSLCSHAGFCSRAGGIKTLIRQSASPEAAAMAIEVAAHCNSGRLVVWDRKTGNPVEKEFEPSIALIQLPHKGCSGPIWVRGGIPIESSAGFTHEIRNRVSLCRCGRSSNKPFCDGTHADVKFNDGQL